MSVRTQGGTERVHVNVGFSLGTGDWIGLSWFKLKGLSNFHDMMLIMENISGTGQIVESGYSSNSVPPNIGLWTRNGWGIQNEDYTLIADQWYGWVVGRTGADVTIRLFLENGTKVQTATISPGAGVNMDLLDWLSLGTIFGGEENDGEWELFKFVEGVYWTDTECVTELGNYIIQTAGGTPHLEATLIDLATGLTDNSGAGNDLTAVSMINGASTPYPLVAGSVLHIPGRRR